MVSSEFLPRPSPYRLANPPLGELSRGTRVRPLHEVRGYHHPSLHPSLRTSTKQGDYRHRVDNAFAYAYASVHRSHAASVLWPSGDVDEDMLGSGFRVGFTVRQNIDSGIVDGEIMEMDEDVLVPGRGEDVAMGPQFAPSDSLPFGPRIVELA